MSKLPTAEEVYTDFHFNYKGDNNSVIEAMAEFAKLHVEAALKAASENADTLKGEVYASKGCIDKDSILNAYPLNNIK